MQNGAQQDQVCMQPGGLKIIMDGCSMHLVSCLVLECSSSWSVMRMSGGTDGGWEELGVWLLGGM